MLAGVIAFFALGLKVSNLSSYSNRGSYTLYAEFTNIGDLKARAPVTIAGVKVGQVANIRLDHKNFKAVVKIAMDEDNHDIPIDSTASILTQGLLGSNYISVEPGFDEEYLEDGGYIDMTNPAIILENLIGQFLFQTNKKKDKENQELK